MSQFLQIALNAVAASLACAPFAMAVSAAFGVGKFFNLALGLFVATGAYLYLSLVAILPVPLAWLIGITCSAVLALLMEVGLFRQLRRRKASSTMMLLASIGVLAIGQNVLSLWFGDKVQRIPGTEVSLGIEFLGITIGKFQLAVAVFGVCSSIVVFVLLVLTPFGREFRAIRDDFGLAQLIGVDVERCMLQVMLFGAIVSSASGILIGMDGGILPQMGFRIALLGVVAAILGGLGNPLGAIGGSLVLGGIREASGVVFSGEWRDAVTYTALLVALCLRPPTGTLTKDV